MEHYQEVLNFWQSLPHQTTADLDMVLDNFRILFAYHSNAIENPETTYHDTREIFEHGTVSKFTGSLRTLFEIENQKITYEYLRTSLVEKTPLTPSLIKKYTNS